MFVLCRTSNGGAKDFEYEKLADGRHVYDLVGDKLNALGKDLSLIHIYIAALVAVNSVEGTPEEGAPFGAGPRAALDKTLELAAEMCIRDRHWAWIM